MNERLAHALHRAEAWEDQDPDPETRAELRRLMDRALSGDTDAEGELASRFTGRLTFGTAGLRGPLGAGPNRMNRVLVSQTAAGLATYLFAHCAEPSIVIGYDARKNSRVFAADTAEIMAGHGIATTLLPRALPTPLLAYAVRTLETSAGVMVTASHNPAADNGYKVYLGGADEGAQIIPPTDGEIARAIGRAAETTIDAYPRSSLYTVAGDDLVDSYVERTAARAMAGARPVRFVYTALHGVGWETASAVFRSAGLGLPISVAAQQEPDPNFPTVAFPNPEEDGALDLAYATAEAADAELVIANDPDADRLAVALPYGDGWRRLTGNELGLVLGWRAAGAHSNTPGPRTRRTLAASLVSSPGLAEIARTYDLDYVETLTGFKWISRVPDLLFGFEEALGYLVDPDKVRDKDGISAAVDILSLMSELNDRGVSLEEHIAMMTALFGAYASEQVSIRVEATDRIERIMRRLREHPPTRIGALSVLRVEDFRGGTEHLPPSDILRYMLSGGSRVVVRPSGTEPKLKAYIDVRGDSGNPVESLVSARGRAAELASALRLLLADS